MSSPDTYTVTPELKARVREDAARWQQQWRRERRGEDVSAIANLGLGLAGLFAAVYVGAVVSTQNAAIVGRVVLAGAVWYGLLSLARRWFPPR